MTENFNLEIMDDATVYDKNNDKVGSVKQIYLDDQTDQIRFVTVSTGLFGMKETFVPVDSARSIGQVDVKVPFSKDFIKDAPNIDPDGHLEPSEEQKLFEYYDMDSGQSSDSNAAAGRHRDSAAGGGQDGEEAVAHEEQLVVGKQDHVAGKARLRKRVVTEHQQVDVPVEREELVVEREKLDQISPAARTGSIDEQDSEETVTLHEERPVVGKETVATEKVNVGKRKVVDTETVDGEVRKEEIDVDAEDTDKDRRGRGTSR